ncbi:MAG: hypothetical protein MUC90_04480, partial [Thermoplasmata archaeon]|nr:hypothetical protein [Thermoplasmata archaeon]
AALSKGEVAKARRWSANADRHACEAVLQKLPLLVKRTNASLKQLEGASGGTGIVSQLLDESREALKRGEHAEALMSLIDARERMHRVENAAVLSIIADAKNEFVKAKKVGLNIEESVGLLNRSRDSLQRGNFAEAVKFAKESRALIERSLEKHRDMQYPVQECVKVIRLAEALGADVQDLEGKLAIAKQLYRNSQLEQSAERFKELLDSARKTAYGKAAESYELAEKALTLAKKTVGEVPEAEEKLGIARDLLEKDELARSVSMACASMFESDFAIAGALADKLKHIDEFSKGIERDVDSLTEVREAIDNSKTRNLENLRRYASLTEEIIGEAYECAAAYSRVAQDIVKQAYESSVETGLGKDSVDRSGDGISLPAEISTVRQPSDEKRQRLIDMFLTGRVSEDQLDKLLLVVDSSIDKKELV